jgi:hypothetical protein
LHDWTADQRRAHWRTSMATNIKSPIEEFVDQLYNEIGAKHGEWCLDPVIGGGFVWGIDPIAVQKKAAVTALLARDWFAVNGPPDAPPLPLSHNDVEDYRMARGLTGLVGFYARSLAKLSHDVLRHPTFDDFCCGLMAIDTGAWGIEKDENLKRRYPPRPLAGMTSGAYWAPAKELEEPMASYRRTRAAA